MATSSKIRIGIVGASASRGFASIAHVPALQALSDFEISAVCTTRQESAEAAARHYGVPLAFSDPEQLARHSDVDLVTVSVKVPDHFRPVMAAIEAGKHVYCEWPLGRNTAEAVQMLEAADRRGVRHAVGLQGQASPAINYVRDLVVDGYVGRVLSATMIGCAPNWGATIERAYQADRANGANLMTITGGHTIDALCHCLASSASSQPLRSASATTSLWKGPARRFPRLRRTSSSSAASSGTGRRCRFRSPAG